MPPTRFVCSQDSLVVESDGNERLLRAELLRVGREKNGSTFLLWTSHVTKMSTRRCQADANLALSGVLLSSRSEISLRFPYVLIPNFFFETRDNFFFAQKRRKVLFLGDNFFFEVHVFSKRKLLLLQYFPVLWILFARCTVAV